MRVFGENLADRDDREEGKFIAPKPPGGRRDQKMRLNWSIWFFLAEMSNNFSWGVTVDESEYKMSLKWVTFSKLCLFLGGFPIFIS